MNFHSDTFVDVISGEFKLSIKLPKCLNFFRNKHMESSFVDKAVSNQEINFTIFNY